jgi:alanine racemase
MFQAHKPHYTIIPVLKSNAYGHGLKQIAQIINSIPECKIIAVDSYPEYQIIHKYTHKDILIMGETLLDNYVLFDTKRTHFAIWSEAALKALIALEKPVKVHIFVNTWMNREGIAIDKNNKAWILEDFLALAKQYTHIQIIWLMSHLACADEKDHSLNAEQTLNFHRSLQIIKDYWYNPSYVHLEASGGMINEIDNYGICTAGRLGLGLYGLDPLYDKWILSDFGKRLELALDVYSTLTSIQELEKGASVGYSGTWISESVETIGVFPFWYREGLDRGLSGKSWKVKIWESYHEIIWRISMNYSSCLWSNDCRTWDIVHIISSKISDIHSIYHFYDKLNKIVYEIVKVDDKIKRVIV